MRPGLVRRLVCPHCHGPLDGRTDVAEGDDIITGELRCEKCARTYPVTAGIPRFVPSRTYASSFGYQWTRFRQEQIDSSNGSRQSERRLHAETGWGPEWLAGKWVLDAGCGAGRFLEVVSRLPQCDVVGVDLTEAVDAARETLAARPNVHLVQASLFDLPFRPASFDGAYCIGVIQHTPDPVRALRSLAAMVTAGGRIAVTIYERRRFTRLYSKYWLRPLTRRMRPERLLTAIRIAMPPAFVLTEVLFRVPVLKRVFRLLIPVANYVEAQDLSIRQRYQWAVLDTFDMLAPAYDSPMRERDVISVLADAGLRDIQRLPNAGLNVVARKADVALG